jgi:hypothetical protein
VVSLGFSRSRSGSRSGSRGLARGLARDLTRGLARGLSRGPGFTRGLVRGFAPGLALGLARSLTSGLARGLARCLVQGFALVLAVRFFRREIVWESFDSFSLRLVGFRCRLGTALLNELSIRYIYVILYQYTYIYIYLCTKDCFLLFCAFVFRSNFFPTDVVLMLLKIQM